MQVACINTGISKFTLRRCAAPQNQPDGLILPIGGLRIQPVAAAPLQKTNCFTIVNRFPCVIASS
jgi:hypothetical protein